MSMPEADAQLPLKKRARRRLVGAIALSVLAAVVLPMVMDPAPQAPVQDVQIRIPGQEQAPPFSPKSLAAKPAEVPAAKAAPATAAEKPAVAASEKSVDKPVEIVAEKAPEKPAPEAVKPAAKTEKKPAEKAAEKHLKNLLRQRMVAMIRSVLQPFSPESRRRPFRPRKRPVANTSFLSVLFPTRPTSSSCRPN